MNKLEHEVLLSLSESGTLLSGQFLADRFHVSRNAVWKAIKSLQEQGYPISSEKKGYFLEKNDLLFPEAFRLNATVKVFDSIDSTNDEAKRSFDGAPLLVVALSQTNGKGKGGTSFPSPADGLYFTFLTPKHFPLESFLAMKETILDLVSSTLGVNREQQALTIDGEKIGGVIVETTVELDECVSILVGVGFYPPICDRVKKITSICKAVESL